MERNKEWSFSSVIIDDNFWKPRMELNSSVSLPYQWDQYEKLGTIDNFRITAGLKSGRRNGFFYTDSDLHKWADAVSRVLGSGANPRLEGLLNEYIDIIRQAQADDGYLYTFNQIHFPETRWKNLQIEHELYCMGHLIEAGVSHYQSTGKRELLSCALKCADLIVRDFTGLTPRKTPGHQEIEIALIRLYRVSGKEDYLNTAGHFLEKRGRSRFFVLHLIGEFISHLRRSRTVNKSKEIDEFPEKSNLSAITASEKCSRCSCTYSTLRSFRFFFLVLASNLTFFRGLIDKAGAVSFDFAENIRESEPRLLKLRSFLSFIGGSYQQQHLPLLKQIEPKGHSVRWAYMMTAAAMLHRERRNKALISVLEAAWEHLAGRKMYITGGIGSLPVIEGFGRDYELDNQYAYCETCAAIGSIFWNHEMFLSTFDARYADMIEWQMYNAASVGISAGGTSWFYRNPLESRGESTRKPWFDTACCPSNISRLWAEIGKYIYIWSGGDLWISQYIGSTAENPEKGIHINIRSGFPRDGRVMIEVAADMPLEFSVNLRLPGWSGAVSVFINGTKRFRREADSDTSSGLSMFSGSSFYTIKRLWSGKTIIELRFDMKFLIHKADHKVKSNRNKFAVSRGPVVYCIESTDNPGGPVSDIALNPDAINVCGSFYPPSAVNLGAETSALRDVKFIPYYAWGNRGRSGMNVWIENEKKD